jgi:hypothetical protein
MSGSVARSDWAMVWLAVLLAGCGGLSSGGDDPIVSSLAGLSRQEFPLDSEPNRYRLEVTDGTLTSLEGRVTRLAAGSTRFNVVNRVEGARVDVPGMDLSHDAIALWLRGRGAAVHLLPQHSIGPVNSGVQEDWLVELPPGDYVLSLTMGGVSEGVLLVR